MKTQQIFEQQSNITPFLNFVDYIKRDCSQFLKVPVPVYRGQMRDVEYAEQRIRTNRKPESTSDFDTALFNYCFELAFGVKDIRNRCIFASFKEDRTKTYGPSHFVFPKNRSNFCVARNYGDTIKFIKTILYTPELNELRKNIGFQEVKQRVGNNKSFEHYLSLIDETHRNNLEQFLKTEMAQIFKSEFDVFENPSGLAKYIKDDNEVMIFDIDSYYVISTEFAQNATGEFDVFKSYVELVDIINEGF